MKCFCATKLKRLLRAVLYLLRSSSQGAFLELDSDVEEALWFTGRDRHVITWKDWQEHPSAIIFLSPEAFAYYLPSVLLLAIQNPRECLDAAEEVISQLDRSPSTEGWNDHFRARLLGIRSDEYEVLKEWLLCICEYALNINRGSGMGDTFGRAYDTVVLLQREAERAIQNS